MSRARLSAIRSSASAAAARRAMAYAEGRDSDGRGTASSYGAGSVEKNSFERFYLTKVALGDCCGCAERVIDWRDIEHAAKSSVRLNEGAPGSDTSMIGRAIARVAGLLRRAGLTSGRSV